jgi:hypothetical protein
MARPEGESGDCITGAAAVFSSRETVGAAATGPPTKWRALVGPLSEGAATVEGTFEVTRR